MGVIEEIVKNKEEILINFLRVMEGKEATAKVNLDGVKFKVGDALVRMDGEIAFTLVPPKAKKK
jgi:hypothetical protein